MGNIGFAALLLALAVCIYSAIAFFLAAGRNKSNLLASASNGVIAACGLTTFAVGLLLYALISHQFQLEYVASYSSTGMSLPYLISALWAGNAGSLLFWAWLISVSALVFMLIKNGKTSDLKPYALATMLVVLAFFLLVLVAAASPFTEVTPAPLDGSGMSPLLQNIWMTIHPPIMLAGYVAVTVPFAFAIAALLKRRLGDDWLPAVRRWAIVAWLLLGLGNLLGAWWAYIELGWGGYWAWDPVENAGLMPWLALTVFIHSAMIQRRRGMFRMSTMAFLILAFGLAIFGTFISRSGVITSLHSFGDTPGGIYFLVFLILSMAVAFGLLFYRRKGLRSEAEVTSLVSREGTFMANNALLGVGLMAVFIGTIFPVLSQIGGGSQIDLGAGFFNRVVGPILIAVILLAGICTLISWRLPQARRLARSLLWPLAIALASAVVLYVLGIRQWIGLVVFPLLAFVASAIVAEWYRGTLSRHQATGASYLGSFGGLIWSNRPKYGGYLVHLGIVVLAAGIIGSSAFAVTKQAQLTAGDSLTLDGYTLTFEGMNSVMTQDKYTDSAVLAVSKGTKQLGQVSPSVSYFSYYAQPVSQVAIRSTPLEDLYVILVSYDDSSASVQVIVNPLVELIWIGGVVVVLGGLVAFWPVGRLEADKENEGGKR